MKKMRVIVVALSVMAMGLVAAYRIGVENGSADGYWAGWHQGKMDQFSMMNQEQAIDGESAEVQ